MATGVKGGTGRGERGFTLIELMITVAVIGILSAIAYPSYRESVAKGRRAQAITALQTAGQYMERFYAENFRYDQNTAPTPVSSNDNTLFKSRPFIQSPAAPETKMYDIVLTPLQNSMTIAAIPTGAMAGDRCGTFQIDQLGIKTISNYDTTRFATSNAALAYCWK